MSVKRATLHIGQATAEATLKRDRSAMCARQRSLAKIRNVITREIVVMAGRRAPLTMTTRSLGTLVVEGDSRFHYPLHDVPAAQS
jgi:hypothetical protein